MRLLLGLEKVRTRSQSALTRQRVYAAEAFIRAFDAWYKREHVEFMGDLDSCTYEELGEIEVLWKEVLTTRGIA
jgi:hypothetical protein